MKYHQIWDNYVAQAPVWHWPKCWRLRNVNNRQKCTKKNYRQSLNKKIFWASLEGCWKYKSCSLFWQFFFRGQNLNGLAANQVQNLSTSRGRHFSVSDWSLCYVGIGISGRAPSILNMYKKVQYKKCALFMWSVGLGIKD